MNQTHRLEMLDKIDIRTIIESTLVPHNAFETARFRVEQVFKYAESSPEPICLALIGESRTGKSRVLRECLLDHPSTRTSEGMHIPILFIKTPAMPRVKGLVELMLTKMHDPLPHVGSEINQTKRLQKLLKSSGTKVIMLDEFQHFREKTTNKIQHDVADWLKNLVDDSTVASVALIVAGLESCRAVIYQNEQLSGRFSAPVELRRFNWGNEDHIREFVGILAAFEKSMKRYFELPSLLSDGMPFRFYCATGGLIGYLAKLLRQVVWNALDNNIKTMTLECFDIAFQETQWDGGVQSSYHNVFKREFSAKPTPAVLNRVMKIGTRPPEENIPRSAKTRKNKQPKLGQVLSAS